MTDKIMTKWISIDPGNKTGLAFWTGRNLAATVILRPRGKMGKYLLDDICKEVFDNRLQAHSGALYGQHRAIIEEGFGPFTTAVKAQAEMRGYWQAICDMRGVPLQTVNVNEWRRVVKEHCGISWPATTESKKALAVRLVRDIYGRDVTDDEADAVLLGWAAIRLGYVDTEREVEE